MIGWYVHAHGRGHLSRLQCVAAQLRTPVTTLSSLPRPAGCSGEWVELPDDLPRGREAGVTAGGTLHWAPVHHPGLRARMAAVAAWVAEARPALVVVDVSVEVAVMVRAMGVPVVVVAMRGQRHDRAHTTAYDAADALLAPWPAALPEPQWPSRWLEKTWHVGALSRFDGLPVAPPPRRRRVAVLWGAGGSDVTAADVDAAAAATPGWEWDAAGLTGAVTDTWRYLAEADVVVTHGGQNVLAEVAAARRPAVVVPQTRPYDEQHANAAALSRGGLALTCPSWPTPSEWPALLEAAAGQDVSRWATWSDGGGAARAAARIDAHVEALCAPR